MIDFEKGTYDFEDSMWVPLFQQKPRIVEFKAELAEKDEAMPVQDQTEEEEREMLLRKLGSRPTAFPQVIGAGDFAGMLNDLRDAKTMQAKAEVLNVWSEFFHGTMGDALKELAKAILDGDEATARKLIAKICA